MTPLSGGRTDVTFRSSGVLFFFMALLSLRIFHGYASAACLASSPQPFHTLYTSKHRLVRL